MCLSRSRTRSLRSTSTTETWSTGRRSGCTVRTGRRHRNLRLHGMMTAATHLSIRSASSRSTYTTTARRTARRSSFTPGTARQPRNGSLTRTATAHTRSSIRIPARSSPARTFRLSRRITSKCTRNPDPIRRNFIWSRRPVRNGCIREHIIWRHRAIPATVSISTTPARPTGPTRGSTAGTRRQPSSSALFTAATAHTGS